MGENLQDLGLGKVFKLDTTSTIYKINKLTSTKLKLFALRKTLLRGQKDEIQSGRKYLQTTYLTKD